MIIHTLANARVGLIGNPSDGYFGKTISVAIKNFGAQVTLWESPTVQILPHPVYDPVEFDSLESLESVAVRDGYYGGQRLLFAACKRFAEYCRTHGITLDRRGFTISYDTNIPRQVGLAGSSAIVTAAMKALLRFYDIGEREIAKAVLPNLILSVESEELGIAAGLQDRVIQVYGGMVYMDFARDLMEGRGYGEYVPLDPELLPGRLFLAYTEKPSDSGVIHSDVRFRFRQGDPEVVSAMREFARLADEAREALEMRDARRLGELMNANFDLRRQTFGDAALGAQNLEMIGIARALGVPSKFPGSGGAVIGLFSTDEEGRALHQAYTERGYRFVEAKPAPADEGSHREPNPEERGVPARALPVGHRGRIQITREER